jgi:DNA-binding MarR family transcriptional regulator
MAREADIMLGMALASADDFDEAVTGLIAKGLIQRVPNGDDADEPGYILTDLGQRLCESLFDKSTRH